jgi:hypothetical protein
LSGPKKLTANQIHGQDGELAVARRALDMGFAFNSNNRLETGIDGFIELRNRQSGETLGRFIGVQVKTTASGAYSAEDDGGFDFLLKPEDLAYWSSSNIPVIIVLVRLSDNSLYWKSVTAGSPVEPRRLRFDKNADRFDRQAADRIAALTIDRNKFGSHVPPMLTGESVHLNMVRIRLPDEIFVGTSLYASGGKAMRDLGAADLSPPLDWVIRNRRFLSFRDPRGTSLSEVVDEGSVEAIETGYVAFPDDEDDEHIFIDLLSRTLRVQFDPELNFDRDSRTLYFRALAQNQSWVYRYTSLVNETSAEVVKVLNDRKGKSSVRHHAFIPRFRRINDEWFLSINPTFHFTRDGFRPHYNSGALLAGKKKLERNGAIRGQFVMWRHFLMTACSPQVDLLNDQRARYQPLTIEALDPIQMPVAVPEESWSRTDPNASNMKSQEMLL